VNGTVCAAKQVLAARGEVEGDVESGSDIGRCAARSTLKSAESRTSVVHGDVHTKKLLIQEGGEINGVLRMGEDAGQPPQTGRKAASALAPA
jgi:cytoskeletal protein CcmA (bactofilin family)